MGNKEFKLFNKMSELLELSWKVVKNHCNAFLYFVGLTP